MSQRLATLRKRFASAKADADAANREMRQASAVKLAELRALPDPAARLAGLKDPALLPYDREMLERTVADLLPRRRIQLPRRVGGFARSVLRHARYHWRGLVMVTMISIPVMMIGGFAANNTGYTTVHFDRDLDLIWTLPDGHTELHRLTTGTAVVVMGRTAAGDVRLRIWSPAEGHLDAIMLANAYARLAIPKE
ncbi:MULTISPECIES: hypothetical protein [unclassified Bradyrhizobium]|uniref:hypothetical protein n=1 Tax=unclassified Bradyrhizobium TaxID=2631580 RepID=UPI0007096491|nr:MULTISPECIES: hypothetical protein [unclassified Bradyrhizobium]KQT09261.1 hypothetical protein ASG57_35505 [Bradyrhizobium sp. Leaf396]